jgi:hypothetical protein
MSETHAELLMRLIAENAEKQESLRAQLHTVEIGELRIGDAEVGAAGDNISDQWAKHLRDWIAERERLSDDLKSLLKGIRGAI